MSVEITHYLNDKITEINPRKFLLSKEITVDILNIIVESNTKLDNPNLLAATNLYKKKLLMEKKNRKNEIIYQLEILKHELNVLESEIEKLS